jgi:Flp pilus assembly pilin Flp
MVQMKQGSRFESPSPRTFAANRLIRRSAALANGVHYNPLDHMHGIIVLKKLLSVWRAPGSPDPIEYALVVGFLTLSTVAALPGLVMSVSAMFSSITSVLTPAVAGG